MEKERGGDGEEDTVRYEHRRSSGRSIPTAMFDGGYASSDRLRREDEATRFNMLSSRASITTLRTKRVAPPSVRKWVSLMEVDRERITSRKNYRLYVEEYRKLQSELPSEQHPELEYHFLLLGCIDFDDRENRNLKRYRHRGYGHYALEGVAVTGKALKTLQSLQTF